MVENIINAAEEIKTAFQNKNTKNTISEFAKLEEKDLSKLSKEEKEETAKIFTQNALDCFYDVNGEKYPIDEFRLYCSKKWILLAESLNPEIDKTLSEIDYAKTQIDTMEKTVDDGIKHWYKISIGMYIYLLYAAFSTQFETTGVTWYVRFLIIGASSLTLLYKYASTVPGYIALRREMDKRNFEKLLLKFVNFFSIVSPNLPDMYIVTKVNGRVTNVQSDIAFNSLKLFGPVLNFLTIPLILPIVSFAKIMQKHFKYEYHYEEKEYLNFYLPYRIFKFAKNIIGK